MNPLSLLLLAQVASASPLGATKMLVSDTASPVVPGSLTTAVQRFAQAITAVERAIGSSSDRLHRALLTAPELYADLLKLPYDREELIDIGTTPQSRLRGWVILKKNFWQHHLRSLEFDAPLSQASAGQEVAASLRRTRLIQAARAILADIAADEAFIRQESSDEGRAAMIERKQVLFAQLEELKKP